MHISTNSSVQRTFFLLVLAANRTQASRKGGKSEGTERRSYEKSNDNAVKTPMSGRPRSAASSMSMDSIDIPNRGQGSPFSISDDNDLFKFGSTDVTKQDSERRSASDASRTSSASLPSVSVKLFLMVLEWIIS